MVADSPRAEQEPDRAQQETVELNSGGWLIGLDDTASIVLVYANRLALANHRTPAIWQSARSMGSEAIDF